MTELYKICGAAVVALSAVLLLRDTNTSYAQLVPIVFGVCIIARVALSTGEVFAFVTDFAENSTVGGRLKVLLKAAGVAYMTDVTADLCREAGSGGIATYVELFGRCELVLLSLPLVAELFELSFALLKL